MKNGFKYGFLAFALVLAVAACNSEQKADATDTTFTDTSMVDTSLTDTALIDTAVMDTTKM